MILVETSSKNWKHETPEHLRLYDLYQSTDFVARKFEFIKEYSAIEAYQEFAGRVIQAKRRKRTWALYRYVAAILLFVLGGSYYFFTVLKMSLFLSFRRYNQDLIKRY